MESRGRITMNWLVQLEGRAHNRERGLLRVESTNIGNAALQVHAVDSVRGEVHATAEQAHGEGVMNVASLHRLGFAQQWSAP